MMWSPKSLVKALALLTLSSLACAKKCSNSTSTDWVTIWGTMPQLTEPANLPPAPFNETGVVFNDATIRQTVKVTAAGDTIRLEISNAFGGSDLPITSVTVALPSEQKLGIDSIDAGSLQTLTFSGTESFTVPNGALVFSDPLDFPVEAGTVVTISIYLEKGQTTNSITSHPGSRTTSHFVHGDHTSDEALTDSTTADHWYFISAIEAVAGPAKSAIALIGDSITDGRGSTTNGADRWPDRLVARLQAGGGGTSSVAVINQAAGGNRLLADGLGPNVLSRIDRDVLAHSAVRWAVVYHGVNDIGVAPTDEKSQQVIGDRVIQAYEQIVTRLHRHGISVYGATITPFTGPNQVYGHPNREVTRQRVNDWIRKRGHFDAVIDFDKVIRDPNYTDMLAPEYDSGDYLHPNPAGYKAMAAAIDLSLFA